MLVMPFNSARHLAERTMPAIERGHGAGRPRAGRGRRDLRGDRLHRPHRRRRSRPRHVGVKGLLSFYGSTPSYKPVLDVEGLGRPAAGAQPALEAGGVGDHVDADRRRRAAHHRGVRHARGVRPRDRRAVRRHRVARLLLLPRLRHPTRRPRGVDRHGAFRRERVPRTSGSRSGDGVATITLHRPEVRNAFGGANEAWSLTDAYRRCDADDDIRAVVLTGTPPAFCSRRRPVGRWRHLRRGRCVDVLGRRDRSAGVGDPQAGHRRGQRSRHRASGSRWRSSATCGSWRPTPSTAWCRCGAG